MDNEIEIKEGSIFLNGEKIPFVTNFSIRYDEENTFGIIDVSIAFQKLKIK